MAYDYGEGLAGGLAGAASGAGIGSLFGPVGTGIGAAGGFITGLFSGKKKKPKKQSTFDKRQEELYKNYVNAIQGQGPLSDIYNYNPDMANQTFDQTIGRYANRNFQENIVPTITGQYRGGNIMNSSYSADALSRAGRDVQEGLDAQRSQYLYNQEQSARQAKQNSINNVLGMQTFAYEKQKPGVLDQVLGSVAPAAGEWFADYLRKNAGTSGTA